MRIPTPAATLLKPPAARVATGAKAAAAARLLKQAQMRRHPTSMYSRHSMLHASSASPRQSSLCPAFCRSVQQQENLVLVAIHIAVRYLHDALS